MIRPSRSFDHRTFHTARRDQRERTSSGSFFWTLLGSVLAALLVSVFIGCGGDGTGGQPAADKSSNPCACGYELDLYAADMKVLCKPCATVAE